jgi:hypothetical protein
VPCGDTPCRLPPIQWMARRVRARPATRKGARTPWWSGLDRKEIPIPTASTTTTNYRLKSNSGTIARGPRRPLLLTVSPSRRSAPTTGRFQSESVAAFAGMRMRCITLG